ncbi:hypothetical protein [Vagococcus carniphilus]|uniref:hypothetical protein n=1 Tax=Vagococcus carniphilus TaxID=218144 RepID=UPI00288F62C9|nr:hypothetical protein [Vagococcus carniphilus]MDT2813832.1 hypothetical protein [Vagococcus carniphilus]MDT2865510.1 hypothetical protein [Vagococcus carniphilus]
MIGGIPIDTIYLYVLIGCTVLSILLFVFGDIFDFDGPVDPILIVPWLAFTSLFGIAFESLFDLNHGLVLFLSGGISTIIVFLMNFYILVPLRNSEASIAVSEKDLEGRKATVITPIPVKGMGEIKISSVTGIITRPASFYQPQEVEVKAGSDVLIIEIKNRVCYVVPYQENFL